MEINDCPDCLRLRSDYRTVTRAELDLTVKLDEAALKNDTVRLQELRSLLAAVGESRAGACQSVLEHEQKHVSRLPSPQDQDSAAHSD